MRSITIKLCLLSLVVLFSQCSSFRFTDRKYTKGRYHEQSKDVSVKSKPSKAAVLPDIAAKTEISVSEKAPVEKAPAGSTVTAGAKDLPAAASKRSTDALPKAAGTDAKKEAKTAKLSGKTLKLLSKIPFTSTLLKPKKAAQPAEDHTVSTVLSIIGFVAGIISIVVAIVAIFDSFAIQAVSGFFIMAIVIGLLAIACGIVALVLGHGDLGGLEKTFSVLAIALGGAGVLIALIWSFIAAALVTA